MMKNIYLIPTDKPSKLIEELNTYITSEEKIVLGDWFIHSSHGTTTLLKCQSIGSEGIIDNEDKTCWLEYSHKVTLTTDPELINDGVQALDDEFLEWFVKNPSCEHVEIVKGMYVPQSNGKISDGKITHELSLDESENTLPYYKIIIPKQQTVEEYNQQGLEKYSFEVDEMIEEAAKKATEIYVNEREKQTAYLEFINGAKWQAKRIYTGEFVFRAIKYGYRLHEMDAPLEKYGKYVSTYLKPNVKLTPEENEEMLKSWNFNII